MDFDDPAVGGASRMVAHPSKQTLPSKPVLDRPSAATSDDPGSPPVPGASEVRLAALVDSAPSLLALKDVETRMSQDFSFRERTTNEPTEDRAAELHQLTDGMRQEIEVRTAELQKVNFALMTEVA